jgi:hypothetical protein
MDRCRVPDTVDINLSHLIETRNAATHLTAESRFLPVLVFTLGAAALRNYSMLIKQWFGTSLSEYEFFIMPIGFRYPFTSLTLIDLKAEPHEIASIMKEVSGDQVTHTPAEGYQLVCEVSARLISAKKLVGTADVTVSVDPVAESSAIIRPMKLTDRYPLRHSEVIEQVRKHVSEFKQTDLNAIIRDHSIKGSAQFSAYNFASKSLEAKGPTKTTPVIYNHDFVNFCVAIMNSESAT